MVSAKQLIISVAVLTWLVTSSTVAKAQDDPNVGATKLFLPVIRQTSIVAGEPDAAPPIALSAGVQLLVVAAIEQVVQATSVPAGEVTLTALTAATWPDASLGCPQAGMIYAQVVTPGYQLVLDAGGLRIEVHTDAAQPPTIVICHT